MQNLNLVAMKLQKTELQDRQLKKPESELMKFTDGILKAKKAMRNLKNLQTSIMNFMLKWDVKFSRIS